MAGTFQLQVATPERLLIDEQATFAEIPAQDGYVGILPDHAPLMSALGSGRLTYQGGGGPHALDISGGFLEVSDNHVRVLVDQAEPASQDPIDAANRRGAGAHS
jgi:F-type H+-transporting ATPase subunit epsilon